MWSVPDFVAEIWDKVEIRPVHKKVSEYYLECHDEMQASNDEEQIEPKPYVHSRDGRQAKSRPTSVVGIVEVAWTNCELPTNETTNKLTDTGYIQL